MADIFVSYSRSDKARVAPLVAAIEAQGWSVWWDPEIDAGQQFDDQIEEELKAAKAVLVVWTPNSVESRWVRGEARDGADRGILVPVRMRGAVLPIDFRAIHTIDLDLADAAARGAALEETVRALSALVARGRAAQSAAGTPALAARVPTTAPGPSRVSICVLPFANLSADPEQQAFSDGITGDIITELSRWRLLAVRSRSAILPAAIEGAFAAWPRSQRLPRPGVVHVRFGPPIGPDELADYSEAELLAEIQRRVEACHEQLRHHPDFATKKDERGA